MMTRIPHPPDMTALALPPTASAPLRALFDDFLAGKKAALARAVSVVENGRAGADLLLGALHPRIGRARRIGLTGPPGAGKSTLTTLLAAELRKAGHTVGIVAVDPTSPFTGGALLGDRVRMESVALDPGVFIRSMATRGSLGGLASATREVCDVLDAFGLDRIIIETVGVGQSELDIARTADTSVVVLVPESGDSIQTLKAGVMEIADLFVVNKADRPGADRLRNDIELMLGLRAGHALQNAPAHHGVDLKRTNPARAAREAAARQLAGEAPNATAGSAAGGYGAEAGAVARSLEAAPWTPPVLRSVGTTGEGVTELMTAIDRHFAYLEQSGTLQARRRTRLREHVVDVAEQRVRRRLWTDETTNTWLDARIPELESGRTTPYVVADALLAQSGPLLTGARDR